MFRFFSHCSHAIRFVSLCALMKCQENTVPRCRTYTQHTCTAHLITPSHIIRADSGANELTNTHTELYSNRRCTINLHFDYLSVIVQLINWRFTSIAPNLPSANVQIEFCVLFHSILFHAQQHIVRVRLIIDTELNWTNLAFYSFFANVNLMRAGRRAI